MSQWETAAVLAAHPWVARAAACADGAIVLPAADGIEALRTHGRRALLDALGAWLAEHGVSVPAAWRLSDEWTDEAPAMLLQRPQPTLAVIGPEHIDGEHARELQLRLPLDLAYFAEHFPTLPVLPGVVQLQWALTLGAERFGTPRACRQLEMLKFHSLLRPGDRPRLRLRHDAAARKLHFAYLLGEAEASSGRFAWTEDAA